MELVRIVDSEEPLCALAFKIVIDPYVGRLASSGCTLGISMLDRMCTQAALQERTYLSSLPDAPNHQNPKDTIDCGDIGAGGL